MIDIHSHLLPGVDDGSRTIENSVEVLTRFGQQGVDVLVCTPHLNASQAAEAPHERYASIFEQLIQAAPNRPQLQLGWEIMLDVPNINLTARYLCLGDSHAVLVEFPRHGVPRQAPQELFRLRMSGVVPVVAHPERYVGCTPDMVREWRRVGAVVQTDATMLLGNGPMADLAKRLLSEGLVDCLASDNHGDQRSLATSKAWLEEIGAREQAHILTHVNAGRLLKDEAMLPVAPIAFEKGMFKRLRDIVLGR